MRAALMIVLVLAFVAAVGNIFYAKKGFPLWPAVVLLLGAMFLGFFGTS